MPPPPGLTAAVEQSAVAMRNLAESLAGGSMSLAGWYERMAEEVRDAHAAAAVAAGEEDPAAASPALDRQLDYLDAFARDVESGSQPLDGTLAARAAMYARSALGAYAGAERRQARGAGAALERRVLDPGAEHCRECIDLAALGWQPAGTLPDIGEGCSCIVNCHCHFEFSTPTADTAGFAGNPDQPRVPRGQAGGGRFTSAGSSALANVHLTLQNLHNAIAAHRARWGAELAGASAEPSRYSEVQAVAADHWRDLVDPHAELHRAALEIYRRVTGNTYAPAEELSREERARRDLNRAYRDRHMRRVSFAAAWEEAKHPRGQPGNKGEFIATGRGEPVSGKTLRLVTDAVVAKMFPGAVRTGEDDYLIHLGDKSITIEDNQDIGAVRLDFRNESPGLDPMAVTSNVRPGAMTFIRKLKELAAAFHDKGVPLAYMADERHRRFYRSVLPSVGYHLAESENLQHMPGYVWDVWNPASHEQRSASFADFAAPWEEAKHPRGPGGKFATAAHDYIRANGPATHGGLAGHLEGSHGLDGAVARTEVQKLRDSGHLMASTDASGREVLSIGGKDLSTAQEARDKAYKVIRSAVPAIGSNIPHDVMARHKAILESAVDHLPDAAVKRLAENFTRAVFHPNVEAMTKVFVEHGGNLANVGQYVGGYAVRNKGVVGLDHGGGDHGTKAGIDGERGIHAHELGHLIDGPAGRSPAQSVSETPEWREAWQKEVVDGGKITNYAKSSPAEGFAEAVRTVAGYVRSVNEQGVPLEKAHADAVAWLEKARLPLCVGVLRKHGVV